MNIMVFDEEEKGRKSAPLMLMGHKLEIFEDFPSADKALTSCGEIRYEKIDVLKPEHKEDLKFCNPYDMVLINIGYFSCKLSKGFVLAFLSMARGIKYIGLVAESGSNMDLLPFLNILNRLGTGKINSSTIFCSCNCCGYYDKKTGTHLSQQYLLSDEDTLKHPMFSEIESHKDLERGILWDVVLLKLVQYQSDSLVTI